MEPDFTSISQPFSNKITLEGKAYLYFGGTAYLGIPQNKEFLNLYVAGLKKFGLNNGTSRNNNIQLGIYNEAENVAAERFKSPDALITSSGYLAAQLTVKALSQNRKTIYAPATHPSLWLENQKQNSLSFIDWAEETVLLINQSTEKNWIIISNSMNNLFPEIYDFNFLREINSDKEIVLVVDDSHGIGVNNKGLGAFSSLPKQANIELIVLASMAKALGVDAGLVLASSKIIHQLKNTNEFLGASPPSAAGLYAFINAENIYLDELLKLKQNMLLLTAHLDSRWKFEANFPAYLIDDSEMDKKLLKEQILISSFPYPTKNSKPINRVVLSSWHEAIDIEQLCKAINL